MSMELFQEFVRLDEERDALKAQLAEMERTIGQVKEVLLATFEQTPGLQHVKLDGHVVYLHRQAWAKTLSGKRLEALAALGEMGFDREEWAMVNSSKLSALVREHRERGEALPEALQATIEVTDAVDVRVRKS